MVVVEELSVLVEEEIHLVLGVVVALLCTFRPLLSFLDVLLFMK